MNRDMEMEDIDDGDVPSSGAVFTYGLSRFGDNEPGKFWVRNDKVVQVACGEEHTVLVTESGRAFSFGKNDWGQLGVGNALTIHNKPTCMKSLKAAGEKVQLVACGRNHTLLATESGSLYGVGNNVDKQVSSTSGDTVTEPFLIHSGHDFMTLAAGGEMSAAVLVSGLVLTWGSNAEGQCGVGDDDAGLDPVVEPTRVSLPGRVVSLSCGYYHAAAVLDDGRLFAWGEADGGKLGLFNATTSQLEPQEVPVPEPMRSVSCGNNHTVAVAASGRLYAWGEGPSGQLGLGEERDAAWEPTAVDFDDPKIRIASAVAGESQTLAVSEDGGVFVFGDTRHGKLGLPSAGPAGDTRVVWRPTELRRFRNSGIRIYAASCGGCHTVLLGVPDPDAPPPMEEEEVEEEEGVPEMEKPLRREEERPCEEAPRPHVRRRTRDQRNGSQAESPSGLPPLRRSSRDPREDGLRNGMKPDQRQWNEEEAAPPRRASFDRFMQPEPEARSKFDDMLFLGESEDEDGERAPPQPARRLSRSLKSVSPSPRSEPSGADRLLGDEPVPSRPFALRKDEDEEEQPKARRRAKPGLFNKGTFDNEDEDEMSLESRETKPIRGEEPTQATAAVSDYPLAEETRRENPKDGTPIPIDGSSSVPNDDKVSVGCGGRKSNNATAEDGSQKSKSCIIL